MLLVLKKISNSLSTDNSIPIFGYSINEADITSASFFLCRYLTLLCVITLLYKVVSCPHSSAPNLTSRTKLRPQSPISCVSPVLLLGHAISLSGPQQAQACCNLTCFREVYRANITIMSNPNSGIARLSQGASQAEFLREGIFRCRAGVGGQGSRAAMESP